MKLRRPSHRLLSSLSALCLTIGCSGAAPSPKVEPKKGTTEGERAPSDKTALLKDALSAQAKRDFAAADRLLQEAEKAGLSKEWRAELQLETGRYQELAARSDELGEVSVLAAEALRRLGRKDEAEQTLVATIKNLSGKEGTVPLSLTKARLSLGRIKKDRGEADEATKILTQLMSDAVRTPAPEQPAHLVFAGRAAALLGQAEASNDFYNQAEVNLVTEKWPREYLELLRYRAALFIEKHDHNQAGQVLSDLLTLRPSDVEGRLIYANLLGEKAFDFAGAEELLHEIQKDNPMHAGVFFQLAGIFLRDMELGSAMKEVEQGLVKNPGDLDLLAMRAAVVFLSEDRQKFDQLLSEFDKVSPKNPRALLVVGQFAEWEHRYPDIEILMRRAARMDKQSAAARTLLGLTLVHAGSDAAGVVELNRAYDLDPYNLRVINTLNLYEKLIPDDYVSDRHGPFVFRFPKAEAELLRRYVPDLADAAYQQMRARYNYTPKAPISVELYESSEQFSVRTAGVPRVGIQGVCFGRKLATMSPLASPGNLGMTLWHELGHVFHIGLSDYRVPRFLTEGLAEWETAHQDRGWNRELDLELYQVRAAGGIPELSRMSRAFTHAERPEDMAAAYYASSLIAEFIVQKHGEEKMVELLRTMGQGRVARDVIAEVLGQSWSALDTNWEAFLSNFLSGYQKQFVPRMVRGDLDELLEKSNAAPQDTDLLVDLGLAQLSAGDTKSATLTLGKVEKAAPQNAQALFALARLAIAADEKKKAQDYLNKMHAAGAEGYAVSMLEARMALSSSDLDAAKDALLSALSFDARAEEAQSLLASLYRKQGDTDSEFSVMLNWAALSEHDTFAHQRTVELLLEKKKYPQAVAWAERMLWVDLAGIETHRLAALSYAKSGDLKKAEFEFESALLCPADATSLSLLEKTWVEEWKAHGRSGQVKKIQERVEQKRQHLGQPSN